MPAISKLLIANRGEIAARVIRTARAMDIGTVAVFSEADADAPYVRAADEAVPLPGSAPADSYLNAPAIIAAAQRSEADAIHPGYGFLSENAGFAQACTDAGLTFVGPPPQAIEAMGSKIAAKELMAAAGVPVLPSIMIEGDQPPDGEEIARIGFPLLVKAAFGGGGRGMRVVRNEAELGSALAGARREAAAAFGDGTVFLERYLDAPRHIEVQIFGDTHGTLVHLFERECSIQRRYQKIIEEAPSPAVDEALRQELGEAAIAAGKAIGYTGAGTVEFVLDSAKRFYFLEVNTRLQVEHPVTELVTGLDLVALQLQVAEGQPLPRRGPAGHADRARHRGPAVRRGRGRGLPARHRHAARVFCPGPARGPGGRRGGRRIGRRAALRRDAGQGDRARPDPGRGQAPAGPLPGRRVAARGDHQPGPAGRHPPRGRVHPRPDRHRLPDPARPGPSGPVLARPGRAAAARAGRGAGRPGRPPGHRAGAAQPSRPAGATCPARPARHVRDQRRRPARRALPVHRRRPHRDGKRRAGRPAWPCARPLPAGS